LKILRAFASAFKDPELKAEAEKRSYEVGPAAGEKMEKLAKEVTAQPPAVLERMKKYWGIMLGLGLPGVTSRLHSLTLPLDGGELEWGASECE
jgi:hypothetical protein